MLLYYTPAVLGMGETIPPGAAKEPSHHVSLLAGYDSAKKEVTLAETSLRHCASSWTLSVASLFACCSASAESTGRSG